MDRHRALPIAALVLGAAGALFSAVLWSAHVAGSGALAGSCSDEGSACARALASRWAYFPPLPAGAGAAADPRGVPVAAVGFLYFLALSTWLAAVGAPGARRRWTWAALLACAAGGALASFALLCLLAFDVGSLCPYCLGAHLCNFGLGAALFLARPRGPRASEGIAEGHPGARLAATALALIAALSAASWLAVRGATLGRANRELAGRLDAIEHDAALLEARYLQDERFTKDDAARERFDRTIRADDPVIEQVPGPASSLVVYGDAECLSCNYFERYLSEVIRPMFNGHLRVVYKHFPLEKDAHALPAAQALEAARLQGKFWEMHDELLERRGELGRVDWTRLAGTLGMDPLRFREDFASRQVLARIAEDLRFGRELGVDSTPTVFLNRRVVERSLRSLDGFWKLRADQLRRSYEARGDPW